MEFVVETVCKDRGMLRRQFDALGDHEQEELVAYHLADQKLQKWQNYRDARAVLNRQGGH